MWGILSRTESIKYQDICNKCKKLDDMNKKIRQRSLQASKGQRSKKAKEWKENRTTAAQDKKLKEWNLDVTCVTQ
jgi:hypothetical protein